MTEAAAPAVVETGSSPGNTGNPVTNLAGTPTPITTAPDWTSGFNDETKGYIQTKGFKDPAQVIDSYRNYEKLMGVPKEQLMKIPQKSDDPEWAQVWDKLGRPKEAKDYQTQTPEGLVEDKAFTDWAKDMFHKNNLTKAQGETLMKEWNAKVLENISSMNQQRTQTLQTQENNLKKEWGAAYDQNQKVADKAIPLFGDHAPTVLKAMGEAIGFDQSMKLLHTLGIKMSEDSFVSGDQKGGNFSNVLTPQQAQYKIQQLKGDPEFTRRYVAGEVPQKEEMQRLHEMAYPDLV